MRSLRLLLLAVLAGTPLRAAAGWRFEAMGGLPLNASTPLRIRQESQPELRLDADWSTRPFERPFYYLLRVTRWGERDGFGLELLHHKLHLENTTSEVQEFSISHGYNLLTGTWGRHLRAVDLRLGAGVVIAHPESTVRGRTFAQTGGFIGGGYYLGGPTAAASVGRSFTLLGGLLATLEGRGTASRTVVPVEGGDASVPNLALHLLFGLGYEVGE